MGQELILSVREIKYKNLLGIISTALVLPRLTVRGFTVNERDA